MLRWLAVFYFFPLVAWGASLTEDFSSRGQLDSGTAIWNQALGTVHPSLQVAGYTGGSPTPIDLRLGDGSHGAFVPDRYAEFSRDGDVSGNIIRLDQTRYPVLNVTTFLLEEGWTLEPDGDEHLEIRSLSDVIVRGEIWCHGRSGSASSGANGGAGGTGRCGGADGGKGGDAGQDGEDGDPSSAPVTGGRGGNFTGGASVGGGGGGSWNLTSSPGNGSGFSGTPGDPGEAGTSFSDPEFDTIAGGAGGGGGGAGTAGAGGGGGAGGGVVIIHAARNFERGSSLNPNIGFIYANGGDGADSAGNGGPGAGGGGGSVQVFAGGAIRIYSNTGVGASQAVGGRNLAPSVGASGGSGRSWFTSITYTGVGSYDPSEEAPVVAGNHVRFNPAAQSVTSKSYDLRSTLAQIVSASPSPASADFTLEWAGSEDNFVSDDTGFGASLSPLTGKRYVKFRFTITTSTPLAPTVLDSVTLTYDPGRRGEFAFKAAAGCGRVDSSMRGGASSWLVWPFALLVLLRLRLRTKLRG